MRRPLFLVSLALLAGCGGASAPKGKGDLTRSRERWQAQGLTRYAYTIRAYGFLLPEMLGPWRIEVRDGVSTVTPLEGAVPTVNDNARSVEALFAAVEGALAQPDAQVQVDYDPARGFPEEIIVDPVRLLADDEWGYRVTEFAPLP
jgi:Family of unknown function (DUF6174)